MNKTLKILAIAMLVITVLGAAAVLYGIKTIVPQVVQASASVTPIDQAREIFDTAKEQVLQGVFSGDVYRDILDADAENCRFVTYTVRLANKGFFPAEWIALKVQPIEMQSGSDILTLGSAGANVLPSGSQGDLSVTLLTTVSEPQPPRMIEMTCYVFGRKQTLHIQVQ